MTEHHTKSRAGRPKAGTEKERQEHLLEQALMLFMTEGVAQTSIARIASVCGVSTRTIYERFDNKYALLVAAIKQMVERDVSAMHRVEDLEHKSLHAVMTDIGRCILMRVMEPHMLSFFRIGISEIARIPELGKTMKEIGPQRIHRMLADIFAFYALRGEITAQNHMQTAEAFCEMLISGPRTKALLGALESDWDAEQHLQFTIHLFMHGIMSHGARSCE